MSSELERTVAEVNALALERSLKAQGVDVEHLKRVKESLVWNRDGVDVQTPARPLREKLGRQVDRLISLATLKFAKNSELTASLTAGLVLGLMVQRSWPNLTEQRPGGVGSLVLGGAALAGLTKWAIQTIRGNHF